MAKLKEELQKSIQKMNNLDKLKQNIEMTVTAEGLRIELLESAKGTFFDSGSSKFNQSGQELVSLLAAELGKVPNHISVEGHTDSKPFAGTGSYSNWELSSDRANAARRLMQQSGLRGDQVSQVRGVCGPAPAQPERFAGSVEPARFNHCAVHERQHRGSGIGRGGWEGIGSGETIGGRRAGGIRKHRQARREVKKEADLGGQPGKLLSCC